jgi:hypothetical protein
MAMISHTLTESSYPTEQTGVVRRLYSAFIKAREAQAKYRMESHLRDHLPQKVLKDIGLSRQ